MFDDLPNLRHLRAFCEVEQRGGISRAAQAVHLSQPAVTQAIAKLEQDLGITCFDRSTAGMTPTAAGHAYANRGRRALAMIQGGLAETIRIGGHRGGRSPEEILPLLTSTQLRAFVAVGTTGNFTLAARLVRSSQPSVHRATSGLASMLGVPLVERTSRGIALTRSGEVLWQHLKLAFAEIAQGMTDVRACAGENAGSIVIGCMPLARHVLLPVAINAFCSLFPDPRISIVDSPYADLLRGLRHGEIDFLIGALRQPLPVDDVRQEALFEAGLCVAARPGHPLADRRDITPADLARFPWVVPLRGTPTRERFERVLAGHARALANGLVESSSQVLIRGLLLQSDRLTLISRDQVQFEVALGQLAMLDFDVLDDRREIGLTFRRDWRPTAVQQRFLDVLREVAQHHAGS